MDVATRPAVADDEPFARAAHHQSYRDVVTRQFGAWDEAVQDAFFAKDWAIAEHHILLCDEQPCGYVSLQRSPSYIHVRELVVLPEFQGRGIGTAYLTALQTEAGGQRLAIRLGVLQKNRAAGLYRRLGFVEYQTTVTHYLMEWRCRE